jgi:predicted membrane protein
MLIPFISAWWLTIVVNIYNVLSFLEALCDINFRLIWRKYALKLITYTSATTKERKEERKKEKKQRKKQRNKERNKETKKERKKKANL